MDRVGNPKLHADSAGFPRPVFTPRKLVPREPVFGSDSPKAEG
jgi:hypothetical protein